MVRSTEKYGAEFLFSGSLETNWTDQAYIYIQENLADDIRYIEDIPTVNS